MECNRGTRTLISINRLAPGEQTDMDTAAASSRELDLRSIYLFSALDDAELDQIRAGTRTLRLREGERLFDLGQPARQFFYVQDGQIKLFRNSADGGEKVIDIVQRGQTFAEAVMFMERSAGYPVNAQAIVDTRLLAFDMSTMLDILRGSTQACFRVMGGMTRRLRQLVDQIDELTLHNATCRLIMYLLDQVPAGVVESPEIQLTTPKNVIASRLSIQPETLSRILSRLGRDGLVEVRGQSLVVKDMDRLREIGCL